ncbi:cell cycle checkpoint [Fistulina hepatica ATCC 64428]|uniref:Checkpoint protein n=1 Tax=Fistulina hepatica ATCC 64428 TaxID=1128425 RepID=A0A0D7AL80_9AGAR|nr:cell cycle checkpoint [Fistulina hepatica ATCC 64428]
MRFRAGIAHVPTFLKIVQSVERLQKKCIVQFSPTHMHLICNHDANEGGVQMWSKIGIGSIFSEYRIESNSNDTITMVVPFDALLVALRSASINSTETEQVIVRLAKKNNAAVLSFEISGKTFLGRPVYVTHDVRIVIMSPSDVESLHEPMCPETDINIILPPLQKLRVVTERMRAMSEILAFRADHSGRLQLCICTDLVQVETEWKCVVPQKPMQDSSQADPESDDREPPDPHKLFTVHVSCLSFFRFLNAHVLSSTTLACICHRHCLILYVYIGDAATAGGVLTFYIPAILDDEEDM